MGILSSVEFDDHEEVCFFCEPDSGLRAIIAIHSTAPFGIAGGGCRIRRYASEDAAIDDALRLSRAMSYKMALTDIPVGGAKAVVIADPRRDKTEALLIALGRAVESLNGRYVIGEDVGTSTEDMRVIGKATRYVSHGRETSSMAAYGVLVGMRAALARRLGRDDFDGLHVAVQGLGNVGRHLCGLLAERGARLTVADPDPRALERVAKLGVTPVSPDAILSTHCDVFAPCALGGIFDDSSVELLRCKVVAGAANNQLAEPRHADALAAREILYAPDFIVNAGGVIGAAFEQDAPAAAERIADLLRQVFDDAERSGISTHAAAVAMAKARLDLRRGRTADKAANAER